MDFNYLARFRRQLEALKNEIERRLRGLTRVPDFGSDVDPDEETSESEAYANQLSIAQVLKSRLGAVNDALRKIVKRRYGVCEKCGKEISPELLKIVPESKLCKECKRAGASPA